MPESSPKVTALFWDVGGVILSNGWDTAGRREAAARFGLDVAELEEHHHGPFADFETGRISLNDYIDRAVFFCPRSFTPQAYADFMYAQSRELPGARAILDALSRDGRYFLAALNNEGLELNVYRIRKFALTRNFIVFLSSCFIGARKPDEAMYRRALDITQRAPEECIFIDDRPANVASALRLGIHAIQFRDPRQLRADLARLGVECAPS